MEVKQATTKLWGQDIPDGAAQPSNGGHARRPCPAGKGAAAATQWPALDAFRLAAALLVVTVHTSPLWSVSELGDFILTRVLARLAVPFFFMASGFFFAQKGQKLSTFLKKMAVLYGVCILLYLPLNWYMGTFSAPGLALGIVRDILWNGTVYHLWYFPAVMLGMCIAAGLCHLPRAAAFGICGALYLVGLAGDSWYTLLSPLPGVAGFYGFLWQIFDYTRNGLFFAPLLITLGMSFAGASAQPVPKKPARPLTLWAGFAASLAAMLAEALVLRSLGPMRHDSMYLCLPFACLFLFALLLQVRGAARPRMRSLATLIFILHPWCIVAVRGAAKVVGPWLVEISPVFYLCVCALSGAAAYAVMKLPRPPFGTRRKAAREKTGRAWTETDGDALLHNLSEIRSLLPGAAEVMAVVKDDAYGHGAVWVARRLQRAGVRAFAVATAGEGIALRRRGVRGVILVLGYTHPAEAPKLRLYRLTQTVADLDHARALSEAGTKLRVHIKVDTGMHRLGVDAADTAALREIYGLPGLRVDGIYTHLARADSRTPDDDTFTRAQADTFYAMLERLAALGIRPGKIHLQSSYGLLNFPGLPCDYVRCGLALYGVLERPHDTFRADAHLAPVLSLRGTVASVRRVPAGGWVGYGRSHQCRRDTLVATVTLGYGDGVPRAFSGGRVLLHGREVPVIGRVCMDQLCIAVDAVPDAAAGDVVTVFGRDGQARLSAESLAAQSGCITNEVLARIGSRVEKRYLPPRAATAPLPATGQTSSHPIYFSWGNARRHSYEKGN